MQQSLCKKKVEQRVQRQLIEAILFERILPYKEENRGDHSLYILEGKGVRFRCEGRRMAFDRIRINGGTIFQQKANESFIEATIEELVEAITNTSEDKKRLLHELWQTVKLSEWNEEHNLQPLSRRVSTYEELESEIIEGHPYHPCFKSRTGFTVEDHAAYGPEAKQVFTLQWIAVKREVVRLALLEKEDDFWKREVGESTWISMVQELHSVGKSYEEYTFLPVHPWQWDNLQKELMNYIQVGDIVPLSVRGDSYRATQSVRTLWNVDNPGKAYVKLPLNMVNTSSLRKLTPHSVCAAPAISQWIKRVVKSDPYLNESLLVLEEYAGVIFEPAKDRGKQIEGQIGAIWRESVRTYMQEGEEAVPFTALMMIEQDSQLFIEEWLKRYGAEVWIQRLIEVSVIPVWHLLVAHGIAVEAHAQNMVLLHRNGWPTRVVLRDFHESVEYCEPFLADTSMVPHFEEMHERFQQVSLDEEYAMSSIEALRELIMDTLFVFHFSELSYVLDQLGKYEEETFWKDVRVAINRYIERFPSLLSRQEQLEHIRVSIHVESLLTRKLEQKAGSFRHTVHNALTTR